MYYILDKNNKIVLFDKDKQKLQSTLVFMPQYSNLEILETNKEIIEFNNEFVFKEDVEIELLNKAKEEKLKENDILRDEALNYGVIYKGILFDSDTDQKVNLIDTYSILDNKQTIIWLGKNNEPLECNKDDLNNIGNLIRQRTTQIWSKNALIKQEIAEAKSVEELNSIVVKYENDTVS